MAIDNPLLDKFNRTLSLELPEAQSIDAYLDMILPDIRMHSEDLREREFYIDTRWLEISDKDDFHESVLHIFRDEDEYLLSIDGNINTGVWRTLPKSNTIIIDQMDGEVVITSELFDLAFLNKDFFVLKKHGDQKRIGKTKYRLLGREAHVKKFVWRDAIESLYNLHRNNSQYVGVMVAVAIVVLVLILLSFY